MPEQDTDGEWTFAAALRHLIAMLHPADRGPYSLAEIGDATGLSRQYIHQLVHGRRNAPRYQNVQALADFFGVPPNYFFDGHLAQQVDSEIATLISRREAAISEGGTEDSGRRLLAQRVMDLSPHAQQAVSALVDSLRDYEQQPRRTRSRRKPEPDADAT